jgi:type I restriction enzyme M protein
MGVKSKPLEAHTRTQINTRLQNLGWILDENDPGCNVFQERAKTTKQNALFGKKRPDYVLYESNTDIPIAIIEAKRPGEDLERALSQAEESYAKPLQTPLIFAFNDTFVVSKHINQGRPLKIDGEELQEFVDQLTALRFVYEGAEILSAPKGINFSREELLKIFKKTNNLLRKEGLRDGYERFSAFSEILFLKLTDESERLREDRGLKRKFEKKFCWSDFIHRTNDDLLLFLNDSVWPRLRSEYGDIFEGKIGIRNAETLRDIIESIDPINLTSTDSDVKGDAFEYFLKNVTNGNKDLGEYFTPRHIVRTVINLVKPAYGEKIYDPFCGTGGFLLEAFKYISLRVDMDNNDINKNVKEQTIYGGEITSTARIAKMNMILFGDGHSNVKQCDSLANPKREIFDVVVTNIPYSQKTEYGNYYKIPTTNADSICVQHVWESLRPNGRAAVIVPETFLYENGIIGQTRELISRQAEKLTIISLPRGVFMPYTPTKTNIMYFKKGKSQFKNAFFFVIQNDGFELSTKRRPIVGDSDLKKLLSNYDEPKIVRAQSNIVPHREIERSGNWNLRPFYYMEDIPEISNELVYLDENIIQEILNYIDPTQEPDKEFGVLEVSQNGIFLSDTIKGCEFTQNYKIVNTGDLVYNPYRVNIGSIGIVPSYLDGMLVSPAYVVIRSINNCFPSAYILYILKTERYKRIIMNYSLSSARANLPCEELMRIKIPKLKSEELMKLIKLQTKLDNYLTKYNEIRNNIQISTEANIL